MQYYEKYIVTKRFKNRAICGDVNLPYGTECFVENFNDEKAICCDKGAICLVTSQNAYDYFSQNDDNNGIERGKHVHNIINRLATSAYNDMWDKVWNDTVCQKYKRLDFEDHWLWNYDFYNANLNDLQYIARLVGAA